MPCGCGKKAGLAGLKSARNSTGQLYNYPDCTELYPSYGPSAGTGVYIVGRGTEAERLFKRSELAEASAYANEDRQRRLESKPTTSLCADAVIAVYGR